jgi:hypothetical protein
MPLGSSSTTTSVDMSRFWLSCYLESSSSGNIRAEEQNEINQHLAHYPRRN